MPDGGWTEFGPSKKEDFKTIPEAERWVKKRIQIGEILRIAKVSGLYFVKTRFVKRSIDNIKEA
jgi:hypothetical protein